MTVADAVAEAVAEITQIGGARAARLYACDMARAVVPLLAGYPLRPMHQALDVAVAYANGEATPEALREAAAEAWAAPWTGGEAEAVRHAVECATEAHTGLVPSVARYVAEAVAYGCAKRGADFQSSWHSPWAIGLAHAHAVRDALRAGTDPWANTGLAERLYCEFRAVLQRARP